MRLRFRKNRRSQARELVVSLRRGDITNSRQIRWLSMDPHKNYLPITYEPGRRGRAGQLRYDVTGLTSLKGFIRRTKVSADGLKSMLVSLCEALVWCARANNRYFSILFDMEHVFVGTTCELHFVFLPVTGTLDLAENTPLTLLSLLGNEGKVHYASPEAAVTGRHLSGFVLEQDGVFSLNALRRFVREVCQVDVLASGVVRQVASDARHSKCALRSIATGKTYAVCESVTFLLGRGAGCDIRLAESVGVSREHACVRWQGRELLLWDVGSSNGTFFEGRRIAPQERVRLLPGDTFFLDDEGFVVCA